MEASSSQRILLVVGGGIAAYKTLELVRLLRRRGHFVRVVMTDAARQFVTPLSFASLSGASVPETLFSPDEEAKMSHIALSRDADLVVVAPATADLLARMAQGLADDLATTLLLATDKRVLVAPAMNVRMWLHPAMQRNMATLLADGILRVGPEEGDMACGEYGPGRMSEPQDLLKAIEDALAETPASTLLAGQKVIVTSGPTHEPLDPVRYLANRSSGKQGHAIAAAAAAAGADVVLVSGPVAIADPPGVTTRHVETARDMLAAVTEALPADLFIGAAAVADWRPLIDADEKIKKNGGAPPSLTLVENPDILATIAKTGPHRPKLVIGFAAETQALLDHARSKLERKQCDMIVANHVGRGSDVMGGDFNQVTLLSHSGEESWPPLRKEDVARRLIATCANLLAEQAE
ncbi:bifunctional phosphopantothenoylcysteine decarboxylase/phosphopantothenate--cysteine ligase CoaBC [Beijerinckia indica]|uniref:Coenzyme A biosynthesis bifunctional protein CoaBC n=1 Tax=Beijerinckia indica subsp. indica (strain ATCC 9039 / DSM 1715 / NCIMB 8712) TaxID=395963 RepID=B2IKJ8_BEII9|nr:bifunctional phosphopantothenoylcysteine decarboxylase/phosphopantothenate--cysteine ligase CoaBC [Beijerinckia indica]ACB96478.1 phosphopantothenoylcysteine decarboxylase/phosphopantothenate--cysteine ligase [Beijerinckia indica subsp. indica ATCC 9039]